MLAIESYKPLSEFGREVDAFKSAYRIPCTKIAEASGVSYQHMRDVMYGNRSGTRAEPGKPCTVDKVRAFMAEYREKNEKGA
jgi:hypothetical protein